MVHVHSGDVVVILFVDEVDEVHCFGVETKQSDPLFEMHMFFLHLLDNRREQVFHLFLQLVHFWYLCVGVLADNVLQLRPLHFFTFVVEERTLALGNQTLLANESWFAAICIDADHVALVPVYTVGTVLYWFAHIYQIYNPLVP